MSIAVLLPTDVAKYITAWIAESTPKYQFIKGILES
jgi:hypothetical protein